MQSLGHRVMGGAGTHAEAVNLTRAKQPGLILADIQLGDGSSGSMPWNELLHSFEVPVIFSRQSRRRSSGRPQRTAAGLASIPDRDDLLHRLALGVGARSVALALARAQEIVRSGAAPHVDLPC